MDDRTARQILGVGEDASLAAIKSRYRSLSKKFHPDVPLTGDSKIFVQISIAYNTLCGISLGVKLTDSQREDIDYAIHINYEVRNYVEGIRDDFVRDVKRISEIYSSRIYSSINSSTSKYNLEMRLKGEIAKTYLDAGAEIKLHVIAIMKKMRSPDSEFLYSIFEEQLKNRRAYWLINLWKNPTLILSVIMQILLFSGKDLPILSSQYKSVWLPMVLLYGPFALLFVTSAVLLFQYWRLSPRKQFVPPMLSAVNIQSDLSEEAKNIPTTQGEAATVGGMVGLPILMIEPITGLIVTVLTALFGSMFGKDFAEIRKQTRDSVVDKFENAIEDTIRHVEDMIESYIDELKESAIKSYIYNINNIKRLTTQKKIPMILLGYKDLDNR